MKSGVIRPAPGFLALFLGLMLGVPGPVVRAQDPPAATAAAPNIQVVRQKEILVRNLLGSSPVAGRVADSGNEEAKRLFRAAQSLSDHAGTQLSVGDFRGADANLNQAMASIGQASRMVPDPRVRQIEDRVRCTRLLEGIESLRASYSRHWTRINARKPGAKATDPELDAIDAMVGKAKVDLAADEPARAAATLSQAERALFVRMNALLGAATLEYSEQFATRAEEFAYEMARNRSIEELVPVALGDLKPGEDARRLMDRFVEENRILRERAQHAAQAENYEEALKSIRAGTGVLHKALQTAGLAMPQDTSAETRD
jgi:hypothetical protein